MQDTEFDYNQQSNEDNWTAPSFNGDQKRKLLQIVSEGMRTLHEIDDLKAGLNDAIKAVAEELEIKSSILKKAITIAHKAKLTETNQNHETLNSILETVNMTL